MLGLLLAIAALALASCTTPYALGERRYREGDRLGALEIWRGMRSDDPSYKAAQRRVHEVEAEFDRLVERYKKRGRYYERAGRLGESVLNYRLALQLQPDDAQTLADVQTLARRLAAERAEIRTRFRADFDAGHLAAARGELKALRKVDPFSMEFAADERVLEDALEGEIASRLARGRRGYEEGRHKSAERVFREVIELDPENESALGYLSYIERIRAGDLEAADAGSAPPQQASASRAEIRAEGLYQKALSAERGGDAYAAIQLDGRALDANPAHPRARQHRDQLRRTLQPELTTLIRSGRDHYEQEDLQSALDQWRRALLIDPANEQAQEYTQRAERLLENLERLRSEPGGDAE